MRRSIQSDFTRCIDNYCIDSKRIVIRDFDFNSLQKLQK